jgi:hypothetical protein
MQSVNGKRIQLSINQFPIINSNLLEIKKLESRNMKTSKHITVILLFSLGFVISSQAQDTILNRNVTVEREYRPVIHDAGKMNSLPEILEPNVEKSPATYSDFNLPLNVDYNIHTLPAAELATEKPTNKEGYARVGIGNYLNTLVDFAYPIVNKPDMRLDFSLNHLGTFEPKRMHSTSKAALSFDKIFKTVDLYAGVGGGHEFFKYYGNNFNVDSILDLKTLATGYGSSIYSEKNRAGVSSAPRLFNLYTLATDPIGDIFWRFNATAGLHSLPLATDLQYLAELNYNIFSSVNGLTENVIYTRAKFSSPIQKNRIGLDFDLYNMMYNSAKIPSFNFWNTYSVLILNPYYSIERTNWNVRLGLKSSFSFVHGNLVNPSADVRAEWKPFPKFLSIYAGINGDYEVNTLNKIFSENPYLYSDVRVNDTYSPYNLFAGIKLKPVYNLLLDAYVEFRQIDNQYFFVNKEYRLVNSALTMPLVDSLLFINRFNVIYSSASVFKIGVRANYNLQNFLNVELKGAYNNWNVSTEQYAWNKPKYEAELNTNVRINPNFNVSANVYYQGERYAKLGNTAIRMHDKVDINLGASYSYLNWFTAFAKINNLINNQYQNFYGYDVQGTNAMIGAAFTF